MEKHKVVLRANRANVLEAYHHPWVFSKGLAGKPDLSPGTQVRVVSQDGRHLGWGFYHPHNSIAVRMLTFDKDPMDEAVWRKRIRAALELRRTCLDPSQQNYRLIHGENDGFPGLSVDRYGDLLCMQVVSAGFEIMKADLAVWLREETGARAVFERSEGASRKQEGLPPSKGMLVGDYPFPFEIEEGGLRFAIDPGQGQKTGFFLDQYRQRQRVASLSRGRRVLDLCCYTGGFTLAALRGGAAHVCSLDSSAWALEQLQEGLERNGLDPQRQTSVKADVFDWLKHGEEEPFDLVILDPPALAKSLRDVERARMAYRHLNRDAAKFVVSGGQLFTFTCSGVIDAETFRKSVFLGLRDARRQGRVVAHFGPGADHPVDLCFPEGRYFEGLAIYLAA